MSRPAASLGECSLLGALVEKLWVNSFLSLVGLQLVPVSKTTEVKAGLLGSIHADLLRSFLVFGSKLT